MTHGPRNYPYITEGSMERCVDGLQVWDYSNPVDDAAARQVQHILKEQYGFDGVQVIGCMAPLDADKQKAKGRGIWTIPPHVLVQLESGEKRILNIRNQISEEACEIGTDICQYYRDEGVTTQEFFKNQNDKYVTSITNGDAQCSAHLTNFVEARPSRVSQNVTAEDLGVALGKMRNASEKINESSDLIAKTQRYSDETAMILWREGPSGMEMVTGDADYESAKRSINNVIANWPEFTSMIQEGEGKRYANMMKDMPSGILIKPDFGLHIVSALSAPRCYTVDPGPCISYDMALSALRIVCCNRCEGMTRNEFVDLESFTNAYSQTIGESVALRDVLEAMKRVAMQESLILPGLYQYLDDPEAEFPNDVVAGFVIGKAKDIEYVTQLQQAYQKYTPKIPVTGREKKRSPDNN